MGRCPWLFMLLLIAACTPDASIALGPRLVQEVTLGPSAVLPTRALSPSPSPIVIAVATAAPMAVTIVADVPDFVLVTPTLPPSKTPTRTPTITSTFTRTPLATATSPFSATSALPPPINFSSTGRAAQPCQANWFFIQPQLPQCPLGEALVSQAAFQHFQQGSMIWVAQQTAIYAVYDGLTIPRWQVFRDTYVEGAPEADLSDSAPPFTWQPRRGFGEVWRTHPDVRQRLGWSLQESEEPYTTQVQIASDGTIFLAEPGGGIIGLRPGGQGWDRYPGA